MVLGMSNELRKAIKPTLNKWSADTGYQWHDLADFIDNDELPDNKLTPFLIVDFGTSNVELETLAAPNNYGWNELGQFTLHVVVPSFTDSVVALTICDDIRDSLSYQRFNNVVIESMTTFSNQSGAAIQINGPWRGWTSMGSYSATTFD